MHYDMGGTYLSLNVGISQKPKSQVRLVNRGPLKTKFFIFIKNHH